MPDSRPGSRDGGVRSSSRESILRPSSFGSRPTSRGSVGVDGEQRPVSRGSVTIDDRPNSRGGLDVSASLDGTWEEQQPGHVDDASVAFPSADPFPERPQSRLSDDAELSDDSEEPVDSEPAAAAARSNLLPHVVGSTSKAEAGTVAERGRPDLSLRADEGLTLFMPQPLSPIPDTPVVIPPRRVGSDASAAHGNLIDMLTKSKPDPEPEPEMLPVDLRKLKGKLQLNEQPSDKVEVAPPLVGAKSRMNAFKRAKIMKFVVRSCIL